MGQQSSPGNSASPALSAEKNAWRDGLLDFIKIACESSVRLNEQDLEAFTREAGDIRHRLSGSSRAPEITAHIEAVSGLLADANQKAHQSIESLLRETRETTALLLDFIKSSGAAVSEESIQQIREELMAAESADALVEARGKLAERLDSLRGEIVGQRQRNHSLTEKLQDRVEILEKVLSAAPRPVVRPPVQKSAAAPPAPADPATGLPSLSAAEAALRRLSGMPGVFAGVFYVQRMPHINSRFGPTIGNEVLLLSSQHLADRMLRNDDQIFRWHGPAFVTLISREQSLAQVRAEARRFLAVPLNRLFESDRHSTYLSISLSGEVFPLADSSYPEALERVTTFLAQSPDSRG